MGFRMGYSDLLQDQFCHVLCFRSMKGQGEGVENPIFQCSQICQ